MVDLMLAVVVFAVVAAVHLMICRRRAKGKLYVRELLCLSLVGLAVSLTLSFVLPQAVFVGPRLILTAAVFYILLIPAYLCFYVLTLLVSPSKKILSLLAQGALSKTKIHQALAVEQFVQSRLADLIASGMVRDEGRLVLTVQGRVSYSLACLFEAFIGRGKGG